MDYLKRQLEMGVEADQIMRLGTMLLCSGTGGYRVVRAMKRAARSIGFDDLAVVVNIDSLVCTFYKGSEFRTLVSSNAVLAINSSRIEAIEDFTHNRLHHPITLGELQATLDWIEQVTGPRWSWWEKALAAGLACAGFALLNHFLLLTSAIVAVAAGIGQIVRGLLAHRHFNHLGTTAIAGVISSLVFFGLGLLAFHQGIIGRDQLSAGYVASVLYLIPGFPLFAALLDLARFDITAGFSRLIYAIQISLAATFAVTMTGLAISLNPSHPIYYETGLKWFGIATVASFFGIAGFAVLFNSSRRMIVLAASLGTVVNLVRLALVELGYPLFLCAFIGGLLIGLMGPALVGRFDIPRITMTVPASVIMIPGPMMYRAVYGLVSHDISSAIANAVDAGLVIFFIAGGLSVARMATDKDWAFGHPIDFRKKLV
ncbi:threonine/serine exporter family protein [Corynebacterium sp. ES2794-CONJ1]|uniref:threonine/serine ThrE exporter family protein n=1 Tax=unclassified Corynebacterium TaxID=2624378 RepID=UPI0021670588|nr:MULTISPECIES: threonine/serine exporter family protein [unclassified Corynebacterium]MCS4490361.1 threonine/serine exporter family protein [Corynebacterium sp. ES2775-CONJ]MCS4492139.1 threonine/serine exporter family protein [Corynebacterium sp. ES2715-CONJ3]MCS4532377.1 threonine/serine exporter family protein [Corynebacterium sp. ES2730-CONJ]MCU9519660.1 threonine/serine exporter family protein [Corynebacterium sp. ES2794-CONJ1]